MHLAIDGIIFELQDRGGISRIFTTILPLMCDLDPDLQITVYFARRPRYRLPAHPRIQTQLLLPLTRILRPRRYWKRIIPVVRSLALAFGVNRRENTVWHSTYFTYPLGRTLPNVVTIYDLIYEKYPELFDPNDVKAHLAAARRALNTADRVICISETTASDLQAIYGISRDKIGVTYLAPASAFSCSGDVARPSSRPYLLYVGSRPPYKNFSTLLAAFERWEPPEPVELVVVGRPWKEDEMNQLAEHRKRDRIRLLTDIDDDQLAALYRGALAFVHPSLYEGFGIPLLEAMACGCPIVASRIPSTKEIAGDYPFYFEPTSVDRLVQALDVVAVNGRCIERLTLGQAIVARYSWKNTAVQTLVQYYEAAGIALPDYLRSEQTL